MGFVLILCVYHCKIIALNVSTNENLKGNDVQGNFQLNEVQSRIRPLMRVLFGRIGKSLISN